MTLDFLKIKVMELPSVEQKVLIVPVPDLPRFKEKPPFGGKVANTWGLIHGSGVKAAQLIIAEGQLRPADWTYHSNPHRCDMPTFGAFGLGRQLSRDSTDIDIWALKELLSAALKKGKGQQAILTGATYKGSHEHIALKAGGNESAQLLVASKGAVTTSEKYLITHSAHTTIKFVAAAWKNLGEYPDHNRSKRSPSRTSQPEDSNDQSSRIRRLTDFQTYDDEKPDWT